MSEQVELVRQAYERWAERGWADPVDLFATDIQWRVRGDLPDAEVYIGHEGLYRLIERFEEVVDDMWVRAERFIPAREDAVIVFMRWGGRGRASGVEFEEAQETWVFTVRDGKIARVDEYATRDQATKAVGLSE